MYHQSTTVGFLYWQYFDFTSVKDPEIKFTLYSREANGKRGSKKQYLIIIICFNSQEFVGIDRSSVFFLYLCGRSRGYESFQHPLNRALSEL